MPGGGNRVGQAWSCDTRLVQEPRSGQGAARLEQRARRSTGRGEGRGAGSSLGRDLGQLPTFSHPPPRLFSNSVGVEAFLFVKGLRRCREAARRSVSGRQSRVFV